MPPLLTTWQGASRASPTTQTWCGIKQLNRTELANQKETNGSTRTWVFSCHKAVCRRWRGDRAVCRSLWLDSAARGKSKRWLNSAARCGPGLTGSVVRVDWHSNGNGVQFTVSAFFYVKQLSQADNQGFDFTVGITWDVRWALIVLFIRFFQI